MKLEDLETKLGIANMGEEEKLALVKDIQANLPALKAEQRSLEAKTQANLVVEAIKKIKEGLEARFDELNSIVDVKVRDITSGKDGIDGKDGKNGRDGKDGKDGISITGPKGADGADGEDGVGVQDAHIDFDGSLIITLTDGKELNVGEVVPMDVAEKIKVISNGGGTSQSVLDSIASLQSQINTLIPSQTGNSGKYLTTNGTTTSWATVSSGSGTVTSVAATAGTGISITGSPITTSGTLNITNTAPDQTVVLTAGTGISTSGTYPNFTITNTSPSSGGTVTSVATGTGLTGGPITGTGTISIDSTVTTLTGTQTLSNKRIDPRVVTTATASSLTPSIATADVYAYTALASGLTINAPTGTPLDGDKLIFRLLDNGTARALTWDATYTVIGTVLPTTTVINKTTYVGCIYNANNTRWDVIAVTTQA